LCEQGAGGERLSRPGCGDLNGATKDDVSHYLLTKAAGSIRINGSPALA
jgi:hypothetical protein